MNAMFSLHTSLTLSCTLFLFYVLQIIVGSPPNTILYVAYNCAPLVLHLPNLFYGKREDKPGKVFIGATILFVWALYYIIFQVTSKEIVYTYIDFNVDTGKTFQAAAILIGFILSYVGLWFLLRCASKSSYSKV